MIFTETIALTGRRLQRLRRSPGELLAVTLTPVTMVFVLGYLLDKTIVLPGGVGYLDFMMAGVGAQVALTCFGTSAIAMSDDLRGGMLVRFRSLPIKRIPVLMAQSLCDLLLTAAGMVVASGVGWFLGWRIHTGFLPALGGFCLLLMLTFLMSWAGILAGLWFRGPSTVNSLSGLVLVAGSFLSTAFVPPDGLPPWLRVLASWSPVSTVATTCRRLWGNPVADSGSSLAVVHPAPVALVMMSVLLAVAMIFARHVFGSTSERAG
ncbi:ABC transporter permease [Amycolatopsis sp. H20-H5]|uniref:ABC transporter permease n=1 Tax=Amycolatopsis sp. H20-H5 TaxID=3046309 RepID=UPI002DBAE334|nr:ABC transporter permease [Amycolatopsis sp. H20-H5]MEC3975540.1 ABC transporter permease [Amycolatopsis sp. H20-H5]